MSKLHVSSDLSCSNMSDSVSLNESDNNLNHSIKISFEKVEIENLIVTKQYMYGQRNLVHKYDSVNMKYYNQVYSNNL